MKNKTMAESCPREIKTFSFSMVQSCPWEMKMFSFSEENLESKQVFTHITYNSSVIVWNYLQSFLIEHFYSIYYPRSKATQKANDKDTSQSNML